MEVTQEQLELTIHKLLEERQGHLDKANACAGAIKLAQTQLVEVIAQEGDKNKPSGLLIAPAGVLPALDSARKRRK